MKLKLITQFTNLKKSIKNKKLYYKVSDRVSSRQINGLIPELTDNILHLHQTPVTKRRLLSPQSENIRLEEEKNRSKRRRDEKKNKMQHLQNSPSTYWFKTTIRIFTK